jgi:DNA-binding transcriptional MerR regulator
MNGRWKIDELAEVVEQALGSGCDQGRHSGRVRSVPDRRTIRYYTTLGLVDKPAEMRGRTAYYGRRHVLQLVVIKRLQARGLSLLDVQKSLAGADDRALSRWAELPDGFWERVDRRPSRAESHSTDQILAAPTRSGGGAGPATERSADRFWAATPQAAGAQEARTVSPPPVSPVPKVAVHLEIAPGVRLVIEGVDGGSVDDRAMAVLAPALENLRAALCRTGLAQVDPP